MDEWEDSVKAREDIKTAEKKENAAFYRNTGRSQPLVSYLSVTSNTSYYLLSTLLSVCSFTEMAKYLLTLKGVEFLFKQKVQPRSP